MLQVDLRELARGPVETQGQLAGNDPLFEGLDVVLAEPVRVAGRLHAAGEGRFYWRGSLTTRLAGQCRRCLGPVPVPVVATIDALFSADPDALEGAGRSQRQAPRLKRTITWPYRNEGLPSGRSVRAARTIRRPRSRSNPVRAAAT